MPDDKHFNCLNVVDVNILLFLLDNLLKTQPKLLPKKLDVSTSIRGLHQKKLVLSSSGS